MLPQTLINVRCLHKFDPTSHSGLQAVVQTVEHELMGRGRVLLRASGTEPVIRVTCTGSLATNN